MLSKYCASKQRQDPIKSVQHTLRRGEQLLFSHSKVLQDLKIDTAVSIYDLTSVHTESTNYVILYRPQQWAVQRRATKGPRVERIRSCHCTWSLSQVLFLAACHLFVLEGETGSTPPPYTALRRFLMATITTRATQRAAATAMLATSRPNSALEALPEFLE